MDVDLQRNLCTVTPDPLRLLVLDAVAAAVRDAGFRAGAMWIEATGAFARGADGTATFTIANGPTLPIEAGATGEPSAPLQARYETDPPRLVPERAAGG